MGQTVLANLTIDVGTTNTKVSLWSEQTTIQPIKQLKFVTPKNEADDLINFDIEELLKQLLNAIQHLVKTALEPIKTISIASVGESGVLINEFGVLASPMIAWYDNRSEKIIDQLSKQDKKTIYEVTGLPPHAHYSASKIKWLLEHNVDSAKRYTWLCIPDFLVYRLTGVMGTEFSIASRTMVFDIQKKRWSSRIKKIFGIENIDFPKPYPSGTKIASIKPQIANKLGLSTQVDVTIAGHDHMVGSVSSGQTTHELLDSTGTTEGILLLSDSLEKKPTQEEEGIAYGIYMNPGLYTIFTALPSAGSVIQWFQESHQITSQRFMQLADAVYKRYVADDLSFEDINFVIPHFSGSGSPTKSTLTKGLWYGLTNQLDQEMLTFGLFLGLTFELKHATECLTSQQIQTIKVIGPAIKDPLWIQLKADLLGADVLAMATPEAVSRGANIMAQTFTNENIQAPKAPSQRFSPRTTPLVKYILAIYEHQYKPLYEAKVKFELEQ